MPCIGPNEGNRKARMEINDTQKRTVRKMNTLPPSALVNPRSCLDPEHGKAPRTRVINLFSDLLVYFQLSRACVLACLFSVVVYPAYSCLWDSLSAAAKSSPMCSWHRVHRKRWTDPCSLRDPLAVDEPTTRTLRPRRHTIAA